MIAPGQRIGHYLIEKRLGAGGMGEVFRAFDEKLERPVAIKVLPQIMERNEDARARMLREARAASALVHPGIVTVHEVDEHEGRVFFVMEHVEGETFTQVITKRGKLEPREALRLIRPVASALEFAHQQGFVHRDIKSSNLMVTTSGHVKVLDFGLSKRVRRGPDGNGGKGDNGGGIAAPRAEPDTVGMRKGVAARLAAAGGEVAAVPADAATRPGSGVLGGRPPSMPQHDVDATGPTEASLAQRRPAPSSDDLTVEGSAMGTPGYSALELMDGLEADARADVYSLGIVLYELLTGSRPFSGVTFATVREAVAHERYKRARELVPSLPSELDAVIEHALRADRDDRTPSVTAMLAQLAEASAAPRRRRRALVGVGVAVVATAGALGAMQLTRGGTRAAIAADATVALPGPADAGDGDPLGDDGGGVTGPRAPVRLTQLGGCAAAPAFLDEDTVAFELTLPGAAPDVHLLALGDGTMQQLTRAPAWEWRPAPGLEAGEVVYLVTDPDNSARSAFVARDLDATEPRDVAPGAMLAATAARGAYYYVPESGSELRRFRDKVDQLAARLTGMTPRALATSPDERWIAVAGSTRSRPADVCLVDLDRRGALRCLDLDGALGGRADFGTAGALYYAARDGIHARFPADGSTSADRIAARDVQAPGGLAVSPDGLAIVYSACAPVSALHDVGARPPRALASGGTVEDPVAGPGGLVAWVEGGEIVVRFPDERLLRVPGRAAGGGVIAHLAFDADGDTLAFARMGGDEPGIFTVELAPDAVPDQRSRQPDDDVPLFLADGSIVFTRMAGATPSVYRIAPGGDPAPARPGARALGVDRARSRVLLAAPTARELVWWNPDTRAEEPGPTPAFPGADDVREVSLSPGGGWLLFQVGRDGAELWRAATADGVFRRVHTTPAGTIPGLSAITDDGHPLVVETSWQGELWRLDAGADPW